MDDSEAQIFVRIDGFPSYLIGDKGDILSLDYRGTGSTQRLSPGGIRYKKVTIRRADGGINSTSVHRLVLRAFRGEQPSDEHEAHHKNGDTFDNRLENLEWATKKENRKSGGRKGYTPNDYRQAAEEGGSIRAIARILGVSRTTARDQCVRHDIEVESVGGVPDPRPSTVQSE